MKLKVALSLAILVCLGTFALAQQGSPKMNTVTPDTGKAGTEFTAAGENLDKKQVVELYLTDGKNDLKVDITEQDAAAIKFKAPASVKPGRYALMLLTADRTRFIEQPVKLTIEQ